MKPFTNPAIERGVLAGISKFGKEGYLEVSDLLSSNTFTVDLNQGLYSCFAYIFEKDIEAKIDTHLIYAAIKDLQLQHIFDKDYEYINNVINFHVEFNNIRPFAKKMRKLFEAKIFYEKHEEAKLDLMGVTGDETMSQIIAISEGKILDYANSISANGNEGPVHISDGLDAYLQNIIENPGKLAGLSTGYPRLDKAMGSGMRRKSVTVIVARSGVGKSFLADNIGIKVAHNDKIPALILDTEMDQELHWPRMIGMLSKVDMDDITSGHYLKSIESCKKVDSAVKALKKMPITYMNVSGREFDEILAIARRWIVRTVGETGGRTNDCLFIYDYIKLMNDEGIKKGNVQEYQALGFQVSALHDFCVHYDIPCLTFGQVNRDGIGKETTDIIGGSDRILHNASNVFLYKEKAPEEIAEDGQDNGNRKMVHLKTRGGNGLDMGNYINFRHNKPIGKIEEVSTRNEIHGGNGGNSGNSGRKKKKGFELTNDELPDSPFS